MGRIKKKNDENTTKLEEELRWLANESYGIRKKKSHATSLSRQPLNVVRKKSLQHLHIILLQAANIS